MTPFYHTHILLFSMTISAAIVIKATKYSTYYIIHNSYDVQLNIQSSALENVKLSYLVGSVDKNNVYFTMTCLLPKYWKLLPLSHTFIDHAVKHKKTINNNNDNNNNNNNNNNHSLFEISQTKTKRNLQWNNRSWQSDWNTSDIPWQIYWNTSTNEVI